LIKKRRKEKRLMCVRTKKRKKGYKWKLFPKRGKERGVYCLQTRDINHIEWEGGKRGKHCPIKCYGRRRKVDSQGQCFLCEKFKKRGGKYCFPKL